MIKRIGWLNHRSVDGYMTRHELMLAPIYGNLAAHGWLYQMGALRSGKVFALYSDSGVMTGMMARFNDGNCMVHAPQEEELLRFVPELREQRFHTLWILGGGHETGRRMNEALGLKAKVVDHWMMIQPQPVTVDPMGLFYQDISTAPFDEEYIAAACRLLEACFHYRPSRRVLSQRMAERSPEEIYLLAEWEGRWVAQAHIQAWTPGYGHIGGVATLPEYGGRGIGASVTGELCRYIHESGRLPTLTVRTDNLPALKLYHRLGFEKAGVVTVLDTFKD